MREETMIRCYLGALRNFISFGLRTQWNYSIILKNSTLSMVEVLRSTSDVAREIHHYRLLRDPPAIDGLGAGPPTDCHRSAKPDNTVEMPA